MTVWASTEMENLIYSLNATVPVFLIIVLGYILKRIGMLNAEFVRVANKFNFTVTLPALLFRDISQENILEIFDGRYVLFCALTTTISFAAIWILTKLCLKDKSMTGAFVQASFRSSAAVLGIAFIQNIYGNSGMAPLMIIGAVPLYNIYSVIVLTFEAAEENADRNSEAVKESIDRNLKAAKENADGNSEAAKENADGNLKAAKENADGNSEAAKESADRNSEAVKEDVDGNFKPPASRDISKIKAAVLNILKNPIILAIAAGLLASVLQINFPAIVDKTISNLASMASPLALVAIGAGFEGRKALAKLRPAIAASFLKLVGLAAIFLPLAVMLGFRDEKLMALIIMLGSPTTPSCYIMAKNMKNDGVLTSSIIVLTTLLSAFTLTMWIYIMKSAGML